MIKFCGFLLISFFLAFEIQAQTTEPFAELPVLKAEFKISKAQYQEAILSLDSIKDHDYYSYFLMGQAHFLNKHFQEAISAFKHSNQKLKDYASFEIAKSYAQLQMFDSAAFFLNQHLHSVYKKSSNIIEFMPDFRALKNTSQWQKLWDIDALYTKDEKSLERAIYYKEKGELTLALDILDELIDHDKTNTEAYFNRAQFIIQLNSDYKYAINDLRKILKIAPQNSTYWSFLGRLYFHELKYKKSLEAFQKAYSIFPYEKEIYLRLGESYYRTNNYAEALSFTNQFLNIDSKSVDALKLGGLIAYDKADYPLSLEYLNKAILIDSRRIDLLVARGKSFLEIDDYQRAGMDFNIALDLDSQNGELWYLKGLAFLYQERKDEACKYFSKASYLNYYKADEYLLKECQ